MHKESTNVSGLIMEEGVERYTAFLDEKVVDIVGDPVKGIPKKRHEEGDLIRPTVHDVHADDDGGADAKSINDFVEVLHLHGDVTHVHHEHVRCRGEYLEDDIPRPHQNDLSLPSLQIQQIS